MDRDFICLRCGKRMRFFSRDIYQQGQANILFGSLPNLLAGGVELTAYVCPACGKMEFYLSGQPAEPSIGQVKCPACGSLHDCDDPKCPACGYNKLDKK